MATDEQPGLNAIAKSRKKTKTKGKKAKTGATSGSRGAALEEKPPLEIVGKPKKTSIWIDQGVWNCVEDVASALTRRRRATSEGKVTMGRVVTTALLLFYDRPIEEQLELIRENEKRV